MKSTILSGLSIAALMLCCGNCRCCSCGSMSGLKDKMVDKVQQEVTEIAVQEGAEYLLEEAYGDGSKVEMDIDDRHVTIKRPDGARADLWGAPDPLPKNIRLPQPKGVRYLYVVNAEAPSPEGVTPKYVSMGEVAGIEYAAEDREAVVQAYKEWAERQGYKVTDVVELRPDQRVFVPGLEQVDAKPTTQSEESLLFIVVESENHEGAYIFGPTQGQIYYEERRPDGSTTFWWED